MSLVPAAAAAHSNQERRRERDLFRFGEADARKLKSKRVSYCLMNGNYNPYWFLTTFVIAAAGFAVGPLWLAWLWSKLFAPKKPGPVKNAIYECGLESKGEAWIQYHSHYYIYAVIFLVFDVEALFLLPFAVAFAKLPVGAIVAMLIFLLLLVEGLVWAWRKGALTWK